MTDHSPLDDNEVALIVRYRQAANYLSIGQLFLLDNPTLGEPLEAEHIKPRRMERSA